MSTRSHPAPETAWALGMLAATVTLVALTAALAALAPRDTALGALCGGLAVLVLAGVARWRTVRRGTRTGTAARIGGGAPDERDRAVLHRTLGVVGAVALIASALASAAVVSGADPTTVVTSLPFVLVATLGVAFVVVDRRS